MARRPLLRIIDADIESGKGRGVSKESQIFFKNRNTGVKSSLINWWGSITSSRSMKNSYHMWNSVTFRRKK